MKEFYCAAPWRSLHIAINGDVKTCCAGAPDFLGNLNSQSIEAVLDSPKLQEVRESIRAGVPHPVYCTGCVEIERYGHSERNWHNNINPEFVPGQAGLTDYQPTLMDVRWNLTCNLSCNYCDENFSSKWQSLRRGIPIKQTARKYYDDVCTYLEKHSSHLREVALVGGEPLLMPENERLLDIIPMECVVTVITNLSRDLDNNPVFKKLAQRPKVGWSMSFDNLGNQYEYVRHGAEWQQLKKNIATFKKLQQNGHWGGIHSVYSVYNCTRLTEFRQWAHDQDLTIVWQNLSTPHCLDPTKLSNELKILAINEIDNLFEQGYLKENEQQFFTLVKQNLSQSHGDITEEFRQHIEQIENTYHTDMRGKFVEFWPELAFLLDSRKEPKYCYELTTETKILL